MEDQLFITIVILIILLVMYYHIKMQSNEKAENPTSDLKDNNQLNKNGQLVHLERVPSVKPTHMPQYKITGEMYEEQKPVTDFTAVPGNLSIILKPKAPKDREIIDGKIFRSVSLDERLGRQPSVAESQADEVIQMQLGILNDPLFKNETELKQDSEKTNQYNYIKTLPVNNDCNDQDTRCPAWALDNQCITNSSMMLWKCPKSCFTCSMSEEQKNNLRKIYGGRELTKCLGDSLK